MTGMNFSNLKKIRTEVAASLKTYNEAKEGITNPMILSMLETNRPKISVPSDYAISMKQIFDAAGLDVVFSIEYVMDGGENFINWFRMRVNPLWAKLETMVPTKGTVKFYFNGEIVEYKKEYHFKAITHFCSVFDYSGCNISHLPRFESLLTEMWIYDQTYCTITNKGICTGLILTLHEPTSLMAELDLGSASEMSKEF